MLLLLLLKKKTKLQQEISSASYGWLNNYNIEIPSIKVYNENANEPIGEFAVDSSEIKEYKIYPNYSNSDVYDLLFLGEISVDYIVDPSIYNSTSTTIWECGNITQA